MFRRAFWFTAGAAAGVWATAKVHRTVRSLQPDALALRAADKAMEGGHRMAGFAREVQSGMARRENELYDALGLTSSAPYRTADLRGTGQSAAPTSAPRVHGPARAADIGPGRLVTGETGNERMTTDGVG